MELKSLYDLVVIGGGINGAAIARDAAGRGLSVLLLEKDDLAQATSSASTKLLHGGLRYLENYEFSMVRQSLIERERALKSAPHIAWPMEFVLPHEPHLRPKWMIRAGLFLYDFLAKREVLKGSRGVDFRTDAYGVPLEDDYRRGFAYSDCWVEDSRLVVLCAMDAAEHGADIAVRTKCTGVRVEGDVWRVEMGAESVQASGVVNAAGPWVRSFLDEHDLTQDDTLGMRMSKGSHMIVPQLYDGAQAYILQQPDGRIVFTIPYEGRFTLIGTTDEDYRGDPKDAAISEDEITYLCAAVNRSFETKVTPEDMVWSYSGVRPLIDDGGGAASKVSRDYKLDVEDRFGPVLLNVFGGKLTTFRSLAEKAMRKLAPFYQGIGDDWTAGETLPGGDFAVNGFEDLVAAQMDEHPTLSVDMVRRLCRAYGTRVERVLKDGLGAHYGDDVYEAELRYLIAHEWARSSDDILWRRSKLGLHIADETRDKVREAVATLLKEMGYE